MKPWWVGYLSVLIIVLTITAGGLTIQHYLEKTAKEMGAQLEEVKRSVEAENWVASNNDLSKFKKRWDRTRRNWELLIEHVEIDNIETKVNRSEEMIKNQDKTNALAELREAIMLIEHIPERERLTWRNLL
ncbi:MAG: hypothetical protein PWP31_1531 [Clostridia bacterium]|nr:hypothetical protein [Clostridia bacterium]